MAAAGGDVGKSEASQDGHRLQAVKVRAIAQCALIIVAPAGKRKKEGKKDDALGSGLGKRVGRGGEGQRALIIVPPAGKRWQPGQCVGGHPMLRRAVTRRAMLQLACAQAQHMCTPACATR